MPVMRVGGKVLPGGPRPNAYLPCEWCGETAPDEGNKSAQQVYICERGDELEGAIIETTYCIECFDLFRDVSRYNHPR